MIQTLRKAVEGWIREWEKKFSKNEQTESLELFIAKKSIEWAKKEGQNDHTKT